MLPGPGSWSQYSVRGQSREVTLYLLHDDQPKPLVILLQGGGCAPLFTIEDDGSHHPTSLFQDVIATERGRVHFAMIEKPGVSPLKFAAGMSHEQKVRAFASAGVHCNQDFYDHATQTVRVDDTRTVMTALAGQPWVTKFILVGHSEGTRVATGILKTRPAEPIVAAALFASTGPTPLWNSYFADDDGSRAAFQRVLDRIRLLQNADDNSRHLGSPVRWWRTFALESTPLDDVRDSKVPLFVAHGTRDGTIMAPDLFVLEAVRQQPQRPIRYAVLEDGNHGFATPAGQSRVVEMFSDFLNWALGPNPATGMTVLQ